MRGGNVLSVNRPLRGRALRDAPSGLLRATSLGYTFPMPGKHPYPFSVQNDNPFRIFRVLQDIARTKFGEGGFIDLSRGDPGYGFTPSVQGRIFASLILELDAALNASADDRFLLRIRKDLPEIQERIESVIKETYSKKIAERNGALLHEFIAGVMEAARGEGKTWDAFDVLSGLFSYAPMSGGSYLDPRGQELTRVIVADWHRRGYGVKITSDDIILTNGVSHGIGALFKALGEEGCAFFKAGDSVAIASPVYAPYISILEERGIVPVTFPIDPLTGKIRNMPTRNEKRETSSTPKALILIDPNNPTGFSLPEDSLQKLAAYAKEQDLLVITDEVYSSFFPPKKTMLSFCPERTICLNARSKIERSTGLRFGEIITLPEGRTNIATQLGLKDAHEFQELLLRAKAPGRVAGQFQHTTFVPGPAQLLGISHLMLGKKERETYRADVIENNRIFCDELSLPHKGNLYYVLFDLDTIPGCTTSELAIEDRLIRLAEAGVIYLPAYRFFAEGDRGAKGLLTSVRASVVNTTPEKLREAARKTKEVLCV